MARTSPMKKTKLTPKPKKDVWFVRVRGSYLPVSRSGWLTYIPFLAYLIFTLIVAAKDTSSIGMAVLYAVPNWVAAAAVMTWIAGQKS